MLSGIKVYKGRLRGPRPRKGWEEAQQARKAQKRMLRGFRGWEEVKEEAQWL